jgi:hypothetical protein
VQLFVAVRASCDGGYVQLFVAVVLVVTVAMCSCL